MSRKSGGRRLSAQERALWDQVMRNTAPLPKRDRNPAPPAVPPPPAAKPDTVTRLPDDFGIGSRGRAPVHPHDLAPPLADALAAAPPRMDRKRFAKLTRGKLEPEARIDLHGMTLAAAHPRLTRFILSSWAQGLRLVLVITGKGRDSAADGPIPTRPGVLRHQVPDWLHSGVMAQAVLQVSPAHRKHGGAGAYYVYLRRHR